MTVRIFVNPEIPSLLTVPCSGVPCSLALRAIGFQTVGITTAGYKNERSQSA